MLGAAASLHFNRSEASLVKIGIPGFGGAGAEGCFDPMAMRKSGQL